MLDYCGEIEFYPMDGDYDNYDSYTPNISGAEFIANKKNTSDYLQGKKDDFVKDSNYYHSWREFDEIREATACYTIRMDDIWINIPKKIVRGVRESSIFVHTITYFAIVTTVYEPQSGDAE